MKFRPDSDFYLLLHLSVKISKWLFSKATVSVTSSLSKTSPLSSYLSPTPPDLAHWGPTHVLVLCHRCTGFCYLLSLSLVVIASQSYLAHKTEQHIGWKIKPQISWFHHTLVKVHGTKLFHAIWLQIKNRSGPLVKGVPIYISHCSGSFPIISESQAFGRCVVC